MLAKTKKDNLSRGLLDARSINSYTDDFFYALENLRYEGKVHWGKNLKKVRIYAKVIENQLFDTIKYEEKHIFPILTAYIPRLEAVVLKLADDHKKLKHLFGDFYDTLDTCSLKSGAKTSSIEHLRVEGNYLITFIKSHLWIEEDKVWKVIENELRPREKSRVKSRVKNIATNRFL